MMLKKYIFLNFRIALLSVETDLFEYENDKESSTRTCTNKKKTKKNHHEYLPRHEI